MKIFAHKTTRSVLSPAPGTKSIKFTDAEAKLVYFYPQQWNGQNYLLVWIDVGRNRRCCPSEGRNLSTFMFSGMKQKLISYLQGSFHRFSSPLLPLWGWKVKTFEIFSWNGVDIQTHRMAFIYNIATAVGNINNYSLLHMNIMLMSSIASWTCFLSPFFPMK